MDRDAAFAEEYGTKKLFAELALYSKIIGKDWIELYGELLPDHTLEEFHRDAMEVIKKHQEEKKRA
jgi:hypothetical protein